MKNWKIINNVLNTIFSIVALVFSYFLLKEGKGFEAFVSAIYIVIVWLPLIIQKVFPIRLHPIIISIYSIYTFLAVFLGGSARFFRTVPGFDTLVHTLFGVIAGFIILCLLLKFKKYDKKSVFYNIFIILMISMATGAIWEMTEFVSDNLTGGNMQRVETGVTDTMKDMMVHTAGTILFLAWYGYDQKCNEKKVFEKVKKEVVMVNE